MTATTTNLSDQLPSSRRFINQLGEHENINEIYLVGNKQLRQNRNGNLYLQLRFSDRTGSITGMMWNANDQVASGFDNGDYVEVEGTSQFYNGAMQIIVNRIERAEPGSINEEDFIHISRKNIEELVANLAALLRSVRNPHLRNLAECFLADEQFMRSLSRAPAAVKNHHAYHGGLLHHVVNLMNVIVAVTPYYPEIDGELLLLGAFLHDIGKIEELLYERDLAYSDEGQLVGHLVMGVSMLEKKLDEAEKLAGEPVPRELELRLKHMIVSHHGRLDFGSPKVPMTLEAIALHQLDDLDAKIQHFQQIMRDDPNVDSAWTAYHSGLGRKLFRGTGDVTD